MNNPYYTHRRYLKKELDKLSKKASTQKVFILELGVGDGSSELFNQFAKQYINTSILGLDSDIWWVDSMKKKYELSNYSIKYISDWNNESYLSLIDDYYDIVFIDQSPWIARINSLNYLYNQKKIDTIILHDYDYYNSENCRYCYNEESFFKDYIPKYNITGYYEELPPTLIFKSKYL